MRLRWDNEFLEVTHLKLLPSYIQLGDFIIWHGDVRKVITVQKEVPRFQNLHFIYTHFTLQGRDGRIYSADDVAGRTEVLRAKKKWKKVPA